MQDVLSARPSKRDVPLTLLTEKTYKSWLKRQPLRVANWLASQTFKAKSGTMCLVPDASGRPARVVAGLSDPPSLWDISELSNRLPALAYRLDWEGSIYLEEWLALGWCLGAYRYTRYKSETKPQAKLSLRPAADHAKIKRYAEAIFQARDLINTPAEDMGPADLAQAVKSLGKKYQAKVAEIVGDNLIKKNYLAIHTVGRASSRPPRLIDLTWGNPKHKKITLIGKGVCFDTGGLDLKPSSGMYLMKKDMGGAACSLAVAMMIMSAKLPVRLRLLIPAVENSVSGNAYRPTDIIKMRNGLTVEVGNTDAEGRLVLAEALAEAGDDKPAMIIDFATLTGAARGALGTDLPALFCNNDALSEAILKTGKEMEDELWRMPLYGAYDRMLDSKIADLNSCPNSPYAGAITAALFLQHFVRQNQPWAHIDLMAWNLTSKSGRPEGGEAMAVRAVYRMIEKHIRSE